jgi:hypothetical protein
MAPRHRDRGSEDDRAEHSVIIIERGTGKVIWHLGPDTVA